VVALTTFGVAFAAQQQQESVRSAPVPPTVTDAPSTPVSSPTSAAEDERRTPPSRTARSRRDDLPNKATDQASKRPKAPRSTTSEPTDQPEPAPERDTAAPEQIRTRTQSPSPDPSPARRTTAGSGILGGTNAARADAGLPALGASSCLTNQAQQHAERLASAKSLYHQGLGAVMSNCGLSTAGENVAMNYSGPSDMVGQWLESPGHRANLLSSRFSLIGVGVAQASDGSWYGVQVFGAN
jgi:uncharacterized protein YkwD